MNIYRTWVWRAAYSTHRYIRAAWSNLYRLFGPWSAHLPRELPPARVVTEMDKLTYRSDGWRELWDAVGHPCRTQYVLDLIAEGKPQPPRMAMDCDDFASWAAAVLPSDRLARVVSLNYIGADGKLHGHAICVYLGVETMFRATGNWGDRYGEHTFTELLQRVLMLNSSGGVVTSAQLVAWCV